ncbi:uncharacterized protein THITE_2124186 [Thermothielavioides terrestris NRRL 8126]|uniref:Uncharacterized protein n=1 Tax=Thermothielavioides terrestris (strain ATCC 38088 / NRRL 8126) TaxID=578455 RepID=G2RID8_THETT|nr:uncharacterized protein THITE_2124186 [Thermothielavioides terrestris NRRL 8126]AEO71600.1 hypothetical protein THITE_2124186 [Thermothielavioides terrestris NRRL 8126]
MYWMIVWSQMLRSPSHSGSWDCKQEPAHGSMQADKLPGGIRRHSVVQPTPPQAIRIDQSTSSSVRFPTSGLGPEALTVWTHGKGRSPTEPVTGAHPAGPPTSSPEQCHTTFQRPVATYPSKDASIEGGPNDYRSARLFRTKGILRVKFRDQFAPRDWLARRTRTEPQ